MKTSGTKAGSRGRRAREVVEPWLELLDVGFSTGDFEVLREVTFSCGMGELVLILGPNGSGKTTLLNLLSGFLKPTSGRIRLQGKQVRRFEPQELRKLAGGIGRSFQNPVIIEGMSAIDNVLVGRRVQGEGLLGAVCGLRIGQRPGEKSLRKRAEHLLQRMDYGPQPGIVGAQLSAGQRKKTDVARALFADAGLVLLDEPLATTDRRGSMGIVALLRERADRGSTVLVIEHRFNAIAKVADRVVTLGERRMG